jgi:hypothetical protein
MATIDYAIGQCTASNGDHIFVLPGHTETVTAAITLDVAGVTIKGMGQGTARPQISCATDSIDEMTITAANCIVDNLMFNESTGTTSRTSFINIAAANTTIRRCHFDCGQYDLEQITVADAGDDAVIEDCTFIVTADGPNAGIEIEAAGTARTLIRGNHFVCSDGTNAFDAGAINSTVANTAMVVTENTFLGAGVTSNAVVAASAVDKAVFSNHYGSGALSVDEDIFSGDVHITAEPPPLVVDDDVWYVDSVNGNAGFDGHTPNTALVTLAAAEALATDGDTIILASGHTETLTTAVTVNTKINIIGSGNGLRRPTFTINANIDGIDVTADSVLISNLYFNEGTAAHTASINVGAAHVTIDGCHFDCGTNDLESITVATAGNHLTVKDCVFEVTADGPDAAVELEGTSDSTLITGCSFNGMNATNAWDASAVNSATAVTNVEISDSVFIHQKSGTGWHQQYGATTPATLKNNIVRGIGTARTPQTLYVDSGTGTDVAGYGYDISTPLATIDYAIGIAVENNGDVISVFAGHAETVTAAITVDKAGLTIRGMGHGTTMPTISCATNSIDEMTITSANCVIEGLYFNESTGSTPRTSFINVAAANTVIRGCHFDCGQYDLEEITVEAAGNDLLIEDCTFIVTADGPDAAIELEDTSARTTIRGCTFNGGSATNAWDAAAINSTAATTEVVIEENTFIHQKASTKPWTLSASTTPLVVRGNEVKGIATALTPLDLYVDSGTGTDVAGYGYHIDSPVATIDFAIGLAITNNGDTIHVLPGHAETVTAAITVDKAGLTIKSMGQGLNRGAISCATNSIDEMDITQPNCIIDGLLFNESTGATPRTSFINVAAASTTIRNCHFDCGQYDLEEITVTSAGNDLLVENCSFVVTADGPDAGIELEDTSTRTTIRNCVFNGGNATNSWDVGAISSTAATTEVTIEDNHFLHQKSGIKAWVLTAMTTPPVTRGNVIRGIATASVPQHLYVDSGTGTDVAGYGYDIETPVATIDYAIGLAVASNGDVIHVLPGHAENITAGGIDADVIGLSIIGMGVGDNRPTITFTATSSDVDIDADDVYIGNMRFVSGVNDLVAFIDANSENLTVEDCEFVTSAGAEAFCFIDIATTKDRFTFRRCRFFQPSDPEGVDDDPFTGCFYIVDSEEILIEDCYFSGNFETSIIHNKTTAAKKLWVRNCYGTQELSGADAITLVAGATGGMDRCSITATTAADVAEGTHMTLAADTPFGFFNSYFANDNNAGGNLALAVTAANQ